MHEKEGENIGSLQEGGRSIQGSGGNPHLTCPMKLCHLFSRVWQVGERWMKGEERKDKKREKEKMR